MQKYFILILLLFSIRLCAQNTFYQIDSIQKIEIFFNDPKWDYKMDTAYYGFGTYFLANSIKINGVVLDSIGIKYKGNSSFDSTYKKNSFTISLDQFKSNQYQGFKTIKLNNGYGDPSLIREVLCYRILKNYMPCSESNFARVYINGNYIGLYSNIENVNKNFVSKYYQSETHAFFKCNPTIVTAPNVKSNLKYLGTDTNLYKNYYEKKSDTGWLDLVRLCNLMSNNNNNVAKIINLDRMIWMLAFNNALVNLDSYNGVFAQNYFIYKDNNNLYNPILWDMNMGFGGFPFPGSSNSSMASLSISNLSKLPLNNHASDVFWPLINLVQNNAQYKRMYIAHVKSIIEENITNGKYLADYSAYKNIISTAVTEDNNKFFSTTQFNSALNADINIGTYEVPGIKTLLDARINYLQTITDYTATTPNIGNISTSTNEPVKNDNLLFTSTVTNADSVFLFIRNTSSGLFIKNRMYDDGVHNDGAANDNVYGLNISANGSEISYYIYAENANAGYFLPRNAAYRYYTMYVVDNSKTVVINEILSSNATTAKDNAGQYDDYIELYNNTTNDITIGDYYLSDDRKLYKKFKIATGTILKAKSYAIFWADNTTSQGTTHCNFKLSSSGESVFLADVSGKLVDSVQYPSNSVDVAYARFPNGFGEFINTQPTYNANNNSTLIVNPSLEYKNIIAYPNPTNGVIRFMNLPTYKFSINIYRLDGKKLWTLKNCTMNEIKIPNNILGPVIVNIPDYNYSKLILINP